MELGQIPIAAPTIQPNKNICKKSQQEHTQRTLPSTSLIINLYVETKKA